MSKRRVDQALKLSFKAKWFQISISSFWNLRHWCYFFRWTKFSLAFIWNCYYIEKRIFSKLAIWNIYHNFDSYSQGLTLSEACRGRLKSFLYACLQTSFTIIFRENIQMIFSLTRNTPVTQKVVIPRVWVFSIMPLNASTSVIHSRDEIEKIKLIRSIWWYTNKVVYPHVLSGFWWLKDWSTPHIRNSTWK